MQCPPLSRQVLVPERVGEKALLPGHRNTRGDARTFKFDACMGGDVSQSDLFEASGMEDLIEAALDGYAVTIFAFGQTGSGKTHTILGPNIGRLRDAEEHPPAANDEADAGLLSRCLKSSFSGIAKRALRQETTVLCSCYEIYNENVTDLLKKDKTKHLQVYFGFVLVPPWYNVAIGFRRLGGTVQSLP